MLKKADDVYASQVEARATAAVSLDETLPALQVAAFHKKKTDKADPKDRGTPHPDGPPDSACYLHWRFGKSAFTCKKKSTCPWKNFTKPKTKKTNE